MAEVGDVGTQSLPVPRVCSAPDVLQQFLVGEHPAGIACQDAQEPELDRRQVHVLAAAAYEARGEVDLQPVELDHWLVAVALGSAERRPQAGHQFAWSERLSHIIVCAGVQGVHDPLLIVHGGEDDQRHRTPFTQAPT